MAYCYKYPHPAVTADCIVVATDNQQRPCVLLIQRKHEPCQGQWAFPGGFMNIDETTEEAAIRELEEETGIRIANDAICQVGAYSAVDRDPRERVITVAYLVTLPQICQVAGRDDAACAQWFPLSELPPLAFDHPQILADALIILKGERKRHNKFE